MSNDTESSFFAKNTVPVLLNFPGIVHAISPKICYRTLGSKKFKISIEETQTAEW
jgi:hypothetical protein